MTETVYLCTPCAVLMREKYGPKRIVAGINNKITCAQCHRRRYGATYTLTSQKSKGAKVTLTSLADAAPGRGMTPDEIFKKLGLKFKEDKA